MATFAETLRASSAESTGDDPATLVEPLVDFLPPAVERAKVETPVGVPRGRAVTVSRLGGTVLGVGFALIGFLALVTRPAPSARAPDSRLPVHRAPPGKAEAEKEDATFMAEAVPVRDSLAVVPARPAAPNQAPAKSRPRPSKVNLPAEGQPATPAPSPAPPQPTAPEPKSEHVRDPRTGLSIATEW